jgi:hypothetical protein
MSSVNSDHLERLNLLSIGLGLDVSFNEVFFWEFETAIPRDFGYGYTNSQLVRVEEKSLEPHWVSNNTNAISGMFPAVTRLSD